MTAKPGVDPKVASLPQASEDLPSLFSYPLGNWRSLGAGSNSFNVSKGRRSRWLVCKLC